MKKNLKSAGFTLIELLAVITIMGILMMVAIPSVSRTIENSRRDTFADLAKQYINTVRNAVLADELTCGTGANAQSVGATPDGLYYYRIDTTAQATKDLMESGGKSSWSNAEIQGYVAWYKKTTQAQTDASGNITKNGKTQTTYATLLVDAGQHGLDRFTLETDISRSKVTTAATKTKYDSTKRDSKGAYSVMPTSNKFDPSAILANAVSPVSCGLK